MKFLCIPCDVKMEVQVEGIMPEEKTNLVMQFKCKKCGHSIAMLTNKFETEFVSKLGVEMGGATSVSKAPMASVSSSLAEAKEELKKTNPEDDLIWTEEAEQRIKKVPFFVRGMAKRTVVSFALEKGATTIDAKLMDEVREKVGM
jgi:light-independent protochlorophyllide reductase subunit B